MFVTSLEYGPDDAEKIEPSPSWDFVETRIRSLNGENEDGLVLASSGDTYLGISGGQANRYVVAGYIEGRGSIILANGQTGGASQQVAVCGDYNTYESQYVIGIEDVIIAAREFFQNGGLAQQLKWENQTS
jgi:hypothetical protein